MCLHAIIPNHLTIILTNMAITINSYLYRKCTLNIKLNKNKTFFPKRCINASNYHSCNESYPTSSCQFVKGSKSLSKNKQAKQNIKKKKLKKKPVYTQLLTFQMLTNVSIKKASYFKLQM